MLKLRPTRCPPVIVTRCPQLRPMDNRCRGQNYDERNPSTPAILVCPAGYTLNYSADHPEFTNVPAAGGTTYFDLGDDPFTVNVFYSLGAFYHSSIKAYFDGVLVLNDSGTTTNGSFNLAYPGPPPNLLRIVVDIDTEDPTWDVLGWFVTLSCVP